LLITISILSTLVGLAAAFLGLALLGWDSREWKGRLRSRQGWCALGLFAGAGLLLVSGPYGVIRMLHGAAQRAEAVARLQLALQEPLYALQLRVSGPDPFRDRPGPSLLRVSITTKANVDFLSEIPARQMKPAQPPPGGGDVVVYTIPWQSVIENATTAEGRRVAACITHVTDLKQVRGMELAVIDRADGDSPPPQSIIITPNDRADLGLFYGGQGPQVEARDQGDVKAVTYGDDQLLADRVHGWEPAQAGADETSPAPLRTLALAVLLMVAGGIALVPGPEAGFASGRASFLRGCLGALPPLWVTGSILLLVVASNALLKAEGGQLRKATYLILGTVFPGLVLGLGFSRRFTATRPIGKLVEALLTAWFVLLTLLLLVWHLNLYAFALATVQWLITLALSRPSPDPAPEGGPKSTPGGKDSARAGEAVAPAGGEAPARRTGAALLVSFIVAALSWTVMLQLLRPGFDTLEIGGWVPQSQFEALLLENQYPIIVLVLSFLLVLGNLYFGGTTPGNGRRFPYRLAGYAANLLALLVFAVLSFRTDWWEPTGEYAYWHWSYFVGPAEDVRRGGWLLWDVPSWYGFLSILTVAVLPTDECWRSMYLVNSSTIFVSAAVLFFVLRSLRAGVLNWVFSVAATTACVFLLPNLHTVVLAGPHPTPSVGAFRFLWVYVLLAVLAWGFRRSARGKPVGIVLWVGCLAWLAGVLWSFESAVYATTIWLPSYALTVWHHATGSDAPARSFGKRLRAVTLWMLLPLLLFAVTLGALVSYYKSVLGHAPDWAAFTEVAQALSAQGADWWYKGPVALAVLLVVFCAVSTVTASFLEEPLGGSGRRDRSPHDPRPLVRHPPRLPALVCGVWVALYATGSYLILKADALTLLTMAPLLATFLALTLYLIDRQRLAGSGTTLFKMTCVPIFTTFLTLAFGNVPALLEAVPNVRVNYNGLVSQLPVLDGTRLSLLEASGVTPGDPLIILDTIVSGRVPPLLRYPAPDGAEAGSLPTQPWLPVRSWDRMVVAEKTLLVSDDRMKLYLTRFMSRCRTGGFVLVSKDVMADPAWSWFFDQLSLTHTRTTVAEAPHYELMRFDLPGYPPPGTPKKIILQVPEPLDDAALAREVRGAASTAVPEGAAVLVISYGDDDLLKLGGGRRAGHFPQAEDGEYDGSKPADSAEAIAWLEKLRARKGYRFLLIPEPAFWWLDHYKGFREHLESRYRRIRDDRHCIIYHLTEPKPG
jgi:hypothetical protein